jgi:putative inorganic carbon (HCO3(-)) transporter
LDPVVTAKPTSPWRLPKTPQEAALWCAFASGIAVIFSVAIFHILFGAALLAMIVGRIRPRFPRITLPLALFALGTLIAFAFSEVPSAGLSQLKHMYLYLTLPVMFTLLRTRSRASLFFIGVVAATALMALLGCAEYAQKVHAAHAAGKSFYEFYLEARISGLQRHWMAFSGQELYGFLIAGAWIFFAPIPKRWGTRIALWIGLICGFLIGLALLLSYTRSIWLAAAAGALYLLWFWRRIFVLVLPVIIVVGILLAPASIQERVVSIRHPHGQTDSNKHRWVCFRTGWEMIKDHPLLGLGPDVQKLKFYDYVPPDIPWPLPVGFYLHLHNIYIQYAADRGIPTMLMMVWFLLEIMIDSRRKLKTLLPGRNTSRFLLHSAIACTIGSMISGTLEYNLNTAVVLALFLSIAACASIAIEENDDGTDDPDLAWT